MTRLTARRGPRSSRASRLPSSSSTPCTCADPAQRCTAHLMHARRHSPAMHGCCTQGHTPCTRADPDQWCTHSTHHADTPCARRSKCRCMHVTHHVRLCVRVGLYVLACVHM